MVSKGRTIGIELGTCGLEVPEELEARKNYCAVH